MLNCKQDASNDTCICKSRRGETWKTRFEYETFTPLKHHPSNSCPKILLNCCTLSATGDKDPKVQEFEEPPQKLYHYSQQPEFIHKSIQIIVAQKLCSNAVKFNSRHCHFRKKDAKITKIKTIVLQEGEPGHPGIRPKCCRFWKSWSVGARHHKVQSTFTRYQNQLEMKGCRRDAHCLAGLTLLK